MSLTSGVFQEELAADCGQGEARGMLYLFRLPLGSDSAMSSVSFRLLLPWRPFKRLLQAFGLSNCDITGIEDGANQVGHRLKSLIPLSEAYQGLSCIFMVGDSDMNTVEATFVHLLENLS